MKLQLDENILNAYIAEAIRQEINEAGSGLRKLGQAAGGNMAKMARKKTPLKFLSNAKRARTARLGLRDFRKGRAIEGKIGKGPFKGSSYFVRQEGGVTKFYTDAACTTEITNPSMLKSAKSSWQSLASHAKNLRNSARRNMAGTVAVAGAGLGGYALGRRNGEHQHDPWNDNGGGDDGPSPEPWDGGFPWDDIEPRWTPRRTNPTPPAPIEPEEPTRQHLQAIEPSHAINVPAPTGVTGAAQPGLAQSQQQPSIAQQAVQVMGQTANQSTMGLSDRRATNRRTKQNANSAINQAVRDGSMTRQQARSDKQLVRGAERALRTGQPVSNNQ